MIKLYSSVRLFFNVIFPIYNIPIIIIDPPTLKHLVNFPLRSSNESLNIIKKFAMEVDALGIFLLCYEIADTIKTRFNNDLIKATKEVLHRWTQGKGKRPITWNTFIQVLRKIRLSVVADQMEESLN